jgi:membrane protein DedA with SNARE-associated domain/membrane-associated phospholipid phosphatase
MTGEGGRRVPDWLKGKPARIALILIGALVAWVVWEQFFPEFDLQELLDRFAEFLGPWTYLVVAVLAFLETGAFVGLLVPGETTLLIGGAVAGLGEINLYLLIAIAWLSAFLGDTVSFFLGRRLGRDFVLRHGPRVGITRDRFEKVEAYFEKNGGRTVLIGRFVGVVRAIAPFVAGTSGMAYPAFAPYSILGSGLQVSIHILAGYLFAQSIEAAAEYVGLFALVLGSVIVVSFVGYQAWRFLREPANRQRSVAWMEERAVLRSLVSLGRRLRPQYEFVLDRLTPGGSFGLEFTTLVAVMAVSSFVVVAFTEIFLGNGGPTPGDDTAISVVGFLQAGWLESVARVVTVLGSRPVVFGLAAIAAVLLLLDGRRAEAIVLVLALISTTVTVDWLKELVDRPRPDGSADDSFPSGHAAESVFYSWLALTIAFRVRPDLARRTAIVVAGISVTALVGLSRVYLDVHYLSDVTSGWAVGAFWFALFAAIALVTVRLRKT